MALNTSFIATGIRPPEFADPMDQFGKAMQLKRLIAQQQGDEQAQADDQAQRAAFTSAGGDQAQYLRNLAGGTSPKAYQGALTAYEAFLKSQGDRAHVASQTAAQKSLDGKNLTENQGKKMQLRRDQLANVNDLPSAMQWTAAVFNDPDLKPLLGHMTVDQAMATLPKPDPMTGQADPAAFKQWKDTLMYEPAKFAELNKPTYQTQDSGQRRDILALPGLGGAPTTVSSVQKLATPGEELTDQRMRSEGGLNRGAQAAQAAAGRAVTVSEGGLNRSVRAATGGGVKPPAGYLWSEPDDATGARTLVAIKGGPADTESKILPASVVKTLTEARDQAQTMDRLASSFDKAYGSKGVLGIGSGLSMTAKGVLGSDQKSVAWWKDYGKAVQLIERHALFGAALTPTEQAAWKQADIDPGIHPDVITTNLSTRKALTEKMVEYAREDQVSAGHNAVRVNEIANRRPSSAAPAAPAKTKAGATVSNW